MIHEVIARIQQMERCFDTLLEDPENNPELLQTLTAYYESGQWLRDYELDGQGLLPEELKRGVLSQDAVYNFLAEHPYPGESE